MYDNAEVSLVKHNLSLINVTRNIDVDHFILCQPLLQGAFSYRSGGRRKADPLYRQFLCESKKRPKNEDNIYVLAILI